jgi:hypothetical protein
MNIDFDEVRMLRDDYVDALRAENAALSAVSAYLNDGGKDMKELKIAGESAEGLRRDDTRW